LRKELASGRSTLKQVINERLRVGFGLNEEARPGVFRVAPHASSYRPGVDRLQLNQAVDELAVAQFFPGSGKRCG
jgi:hypothetical protein